MPAKKSFDTTLKHKDKERRFIHEVFSFVVFSLGQYKLASAIATRIKELQATSTLDDMRFLAGKIEELKGQRKGQFSIRLSANFRLIFEPNHDPVPTKADGGISWVAVTRVKILEVEDYH